MDRSQKIFTVRYRAGEEGYDPFGQHRFMGREGWTPSTDIVETEDAVMILMDLAGVQKEEIKVICQGEILQVSGVRKREKIPGAKRFHRMEIDYGPFEKLFRVPLDLDMDDVAAEYKNGFLELRLPKKKKEPVQVVIVHEES